MPYGGSDDQGGQGRVRGKEHNNHKQGRGTGADIIEKHGPAVGKTKNPNPTKGGGINRATKG